MPTPMGTNCQQFCPYDYVDVLGDGITDDDFGTAYKMNYTLLYDDFGWRTPYTTAPNQAALSAGLNTKDLDDKASIVYGTKEYWLPHSIEGPNHRSLYFSTHPEMMVLGYKI